ncbi:MAG: hypothetical protein A2X36_09225 [Elusimicrobia bacterium GWA2_69_24]|nr:MAG: hypothetical protein A2X36_09225 [Elusimicrobia bacterium GWA2_69_24]HBL18536.1 enoyl-CoA hydratase [Elusimicrobiota bacterium]
MEYRHLALSAEGPVLRVALNRPEVRNALDETTIAELTDCFRRLGKRPVAGRRAVLLCGAGPAFCAGGDARWMRRTAAYTRAQNRKDALSLARMFEAVEACPLPVIGKVHGSAYGGGLGLVAACDLVVVENSARLSFSECRLGIYPAVISTFVLPKIGLSHARRLFLSGEVFGAALAVRIGLAHESADTDRLEARIAAWVEDIRRGGPAAVAAAKGFLRATAALPTRAKRIAFSAGALAAVRSSPEGKEGLAAFLEKRPPSW